MSRYQSLKFLKGAQRVREFLIRERRRLLSVVATKKLAGGVRSTVRWADLLAEQRLIPPLVRLWKGFPVLCEEAAHNPKLKKLAKEVGFLPCESGFTMLPEDYLSVDGLDGSPPYESGLLDLVTMSMGQIRRGKPRAGIVLHLTETEAYHTGLPGFKAGVVYRGNREFKPEPKRPLNKNMIGLDLCKAVGHRDPRFAKQVALKLALTKEFRYPVNEPTVIGGLHVLQGKLVAYITSNAHNWDAAGITALLIAAGMVVRCLDGSPVPWNRVRLPIIVFARDEKTFRAIQRYAPGYLKARKYKSNNLPRW